MIIYIYRGYMLLPRNGNKSEKMAKNYDRYGFQLLPRVGTEGTTIFESQLKVNIGADLVF